MALAISHLDSVAGLVVNVVAGGTATTVGVRAADGETAQVELPGRPDGRAADQVAACYRRLVWQRIDVHGDRVECRLRGVRHRLPADRLIGLGAALALAERGLPTLVRVAG